MLYGILCGSALSQSKLKPHFEVKVTWPSMNFKDCWFQALFEVAGYVKRSASAVHAA
jgi:hypothetical protein